MATAGRILIMPKGVYDASATYEMLDLVSYNGKGWICKQTCTGIAPEEGDYWSLMFDASNVLKVKVIMFTEAVEANVAKTIPFDTGLEEGQTMVSASIYTINGSYQTSAIQFAEIGQTDFIHVLSTITQDVIVRLNIFYV